MAVFDARIRHKRDTSTNWTTNNPVILDGEIIIVDTADGRTRTKTGDGTKTYTQLPFDDEAFEAKLKEYIDAAIDTAIGDAIGGEY